MNILTLTPTEETILVMIGALFVGVAAILFAYYASSVKPKRIDLKCKGFEKEVDSLFRYITNGRHTAELRSVKNKEDLRSIVDELVSKFEISHEDVGVVNTLSCSRAEIISCLMKRLKREGVVHITPSQY
ncbi:MAG: hypothetical protein QG580_252 [Patescibacteria group bacterium]|jgi:hypothetical protein|nr:hypothetical protein [Patescibacteria group bacterium]